MKNLIYSLAFIFIATTLTAQNEKNYKSFYKTFKEEKSIIGISAPIGIANWFIDSDEKELRNIIKRGNKVSILVFENETPIFDEIDHYLPSKIYEKFLTIKDKDSRIKILVKENKEKISEIIILIKDNNSFITMGIYGDFTYDDLSKLSETMHDKG
ncbi:MAG TPA: DUF4252 domain-containing protein [Lutibacter sp.]|nr:DUF4252 domain-containing protein [Lutibacter sp.]